MNIYLNMSVAGLKHDISYIPLWNSESWDSRNHLMELTCIAGFYYNPVRYRDLKNFRSSEWDPRESLPDDYSRIFEFENFGRTRQRVLREASSAAAPACASGRSSRHSSTGPVDTSATNPFDIDP